MADTTISIRHLTKGEVDAFGETITLSAITTDGERVDFRMDSETLSRSMPRLLAMSSSAQERLAAARLLSSKDEEHVEYGVTPVRLASVIPSHAGTKMVLELALLEKGTPQAGLLRLSVSIDELRKLCAVLVSQNQT